MTLEGLHGSVVELDIWATWCLPFREEFPGIEKLRSEFGAQVRFYAISDELPSIVKQFAEANHYGIPMLVDSHREMHRRYGIHKIPALLIIDRDGVVRQQLIGGRKEADLREAIRAAVGDMR